MDKPKINGPLPTACTSLSLLIILSFSLPSLSFSLTLSLSVSLFFSLHSHPFVHLFVFIFRVVVVTATALVLAAASQTTSRHDLSVPTNQLLSEAKREFLHMGGRPSRSVFDTTAFPSRHNTDWMSRIPDHVSLAYITIPGTHNTMAHHGGDMAECQAWLLYSQLQAGIRYLDIRCRHFRNGLPIHHGLKYQHADFPMVLRETVRFLEEFPTEVVIMRVKKEFQSAENTQDFEDTFRDCIEEYIERNQLWTDYAIMPKLGDIRGKIVILQDFRGSPLGMDYNGIYFSIEDRWKVPTLLEMHIDRKWEYVKRKLDVASQNEDNVVYITYTSGTSFWAWPHSVAGRINPRLQNYILGRKPKKRFGILCMDFPGMALIESILNSNFLPNIQSN